MGQLVYCEFPFHRFDLWIPTGTPQEDYQPHKKALAFNIGALVGTCKPGHQHVQHDQVRGKVGDTAQGLSPVASYFYGETGPFQEGGQVSRDGLLVVN